MTSDENKDNYTIIYKDGNYNPNVKYKYIPILVPDDSVEQEEKDSSEVRIPKIEIGDASSGRLEHLVDKIVESMDTGISYSDLIDEIFEEYKG